MSTSKMNSILIKIGLLGKPSTMIIRREFLPFRKVPPAVAMCRCLHSSRNMMNATPSTHHRQAAETEEKTAELPDNDRVNPEFINRNPRNLERMAVARKDKGWSQSHPRRDYWHKLFISKSNRHVSAYIQHINGHVVVQASTKEWAIKQHLYSTSDVTASLNLGRVLAERCLESGVSYVHLNMRRDRKEQEGMKAFLDALTEGGLVLNEPKSIVDFNRPLEYFPKVD